MIECINAPVDDSACPGLAKRLLKRDAALWSDDPGVQRDIDNRLGWLNAARFLDEHGQRISAFADGIRAEGYQQAVLLGMGGSSLAPEVYAALFADGPQSLPVHIVDSTSPHHVRAMTRMCERHETLFIVSSKSGTTAETDALAVHFFEWARARFDAPGRHFVAITDPGSPLQSLAAERGYRETFLNPGDIGGRFSALSYFGLVPAALAGLEPAALRAALPPLDPGAEPILEACRLGLTLGSLALAGRNKLTLQCSPSLAPLAAWIEQLIDESTGKQGTGILVVPNEPRLSAQAYGADRVFAAVELAGEPLDEGWTGAVSSAGHPLLRWQLADLDRLGAEFYRWEVATAMTGRVLGINPFDEPDVNDTKARTREFLQAPEAAGAVPPRPLSALDDFLQTTRPGEYLAVLAYLPPSPDNRRRLEAWGAQLSRRTGLPCCPGFGPRYLHSSGQLHKGGPDQGVFIVLTEASTFDVPIPGQEHGFRALFQAQARGDLQVLSERGRRVLHLQMNHADSGLKELTDAAP